MTRESDEECLALIASIRDKSLNAGFDDTDRLLDNLEARIRERQLEAAHAEVGAIRFRDLIREEVRKEVESQGAAEACRQHVREEVAAEVSRQCGAWDALCEAIVRKSRTALEAQPEWTTFQRGEDTPEARAWLDGQQSKLDKLRRALEAEAS